MAGNGCHKRGREERKITSQGGRSEFMKDPIVSVIIPAYHCAGTIRQAIDSALAQEVRLEVIVVDDCSDDGLDHIMEQYSSSPVIFYVRNEHNMGAAASRNKGVALARGKYVAFLDADDWWENGKLKAQIERVEKTGTVLCCTARELVRPDGQLTGRVIPVGEEITYRQLLRHNSINCSSVLVRTEVIRQYPMEHEDSHEDYILWLKILEKYQKACGINEPLLKYRLTGQGKSGSKWNSARMTFRVYRYAGFGRIRSALYFCSYAVHGIWKYLRA